MVKSKLTIIEGSDCSGKTTFVKEEMQRKPWLKVYKAEMNWTGAMYANVLFESLERPVLLERCWLSDLIYSILKRKEPNLSCMEFAWLQANAEQYKVKLMVLRPPLDVLLNRYMSRGDDYIRKEEMSRLENMYSRDLRFGTLPTDFFR
jgi:thymidylate kinase